MKSLFLIRHATSFANSGRYWEDGPATIPLTDSGHAQARELAARWEIRPDLIVVSPYTRSIQTATPLAAKYALRLVTMDVQEFTFWDFKFTQSEYEGGRRSEVDAFWSRLDPMEKAGGSNAESFVELVARCRGFRQWAEQAPFENCVCVSHGFFMHAFRAIMKDIDLPHRDFMAYLRDTLPSAAYANLELEKYSFPSSHENA